MNKKLSVLLILNFFIFLLPQNACLINPPLRWYLILLVETDDAIYDLTKQEILRLKEQLKQKDIEFKKIIIDKIGQFSIQDIIPDQESKLKEHFDDYLRDWDYTFTDRKVSLSLKKIVDQHYRDQTVRQALEIIRMRLKKMRLRGAVIERQTPDGERIIVKLPQAKNPERVKVVIKTKAMLEFRLVKAGPTQDKAMLLEDFGGEVPDDMEVLREDPRRMVEGYYLVSQFAFAGGYDVKSARLTRDEWNNPAVALIFEREAIMRFNRAASENIGKQFAIIFDGKVVSVNTFQEEPYRTITMTGMFVPDEAEDLALLLRTGALPASIRYLEERTIDSP